MHHILVADDEPFILRSLAFTLRQEGFQVATASDGRQALAYLKTGTFACAILDIMMPGLSGYDVVEQLQHGGRPLPCPVLFLTAKGMDGDRARAAALGVSTYVTKPFSPAAICAAVREHCPA